MSHPFRESEREKQVESYNFYPFGKEHNHTSPTRWTKAHMSDVSLICEANFPANVPAAERKQMLAEPLRTRRKGRDGVAVETGEQVSLFTAVESASMTCHVRLTHITTGIG